MVNDRGQLLLIGALALGVIFIGTVYTLNSLQQTDAVVRSGTTDALDDAQRQETQVRRGLTELATRVADSSPTGLESALRENITLYRRHAQNMSLTGDGAYVNASLNLSASEGSEINQSSVDQFQSPAPPVNNDWTLATGVNSTVTFRMNVTQVDGSGTPAGSSRIIVENTSTGDTWTLYLTNPTADRVELNLSTPSPSPTPTCTDPGLNRTRGFTLDLVAGEASDSAGTSCEFEGFPSHVDPGYEIRFENGQHARGTYSIHLLGTVETSNFNSSQVSPSPVVPAVDYQYRGGQLSYNRTIVLTGAEE